VYLEKSQYERLRAEAFKQKLSLSELLRMLIQQALFVSPKRPSRAELMREAFRFVGKGRDSDSDVARNHDKYLAGL
jgi:hypothetical protein